MRHACNALCSYAVFLISERNECILQFCFFFFIHLQALEFDREGLTKLKKAVKAIYNSGNCEFSFSFDLYRANKIY